MPRGRDTRFARLKAEAASTGSTEARDRRRLTALAAVCAVVRQGLVQAGVDPACAAALRLGEAAASRLAATGDEPKLPGADAEPASPDDEASAGIFAAKIGDMAQRYQDGHEPDIANASLAELFAWCLAQSTGTADQGPE